MGSSVAMQAVYNQPDTQATRAAREAEKNAKCLKLSQVLVWNPGSHLCHIDIVHQQESQSRITEGSFNQQTTDFAKSIAELFFIQLGTAEPNHHTIPPQKHSIHLAPRNYSEFGFVL
ncbi:hypothetical protein KFL_010010030 [Klebsormidium nitens]|uniref:Uncharacterized protein n=1 Tax=Klebsormidium nitens TaxID=105231 RepID=A0A1Y1INB7_KLENI|nr:hypothetical protein KFL_010010030 [Klebsormidium nitens]|eukprot:GAQ92385.1 hypothetical protein KFL_010010030 [Klebsormidium nitens]